MNEIEIEAALQSLDAQIEAFGDTADKEFERENLRHFGLLHAERLAELRDDEFARPVAIPHEPDWEHHKTTITILPDNCLLLHYRSNVFRDPSDLPMWTEGVLCQPPVTAWIRFEGTVSTDTKLADNVAHLTRRKPPAAAAIAHFYRQRLGEVYGRFFFEIENSRLASALHRKYDLPFHHWKVSTIYQTIEVVSERISYPIVQIQG